MLNPFWHYICMVLSGKTLPTIMSSTVRCPGRRQSRLCWFGLTDFYRCLTLIIRCEIQLNMSSLSRSRGGALFCTCAKEPLGHAVRYQHINSSAIRIVKSHWAYLSGWRLSPLPGRYTHHRQPPAIQTVSCAGRVSRVVSSELHVKTRWTLTGL